MRWVRWVLLVVLVLVPLCTLVHRDDLGRWDVQRSAMAGPDEFSYLLMAEHFLQGGGLSLKEWLGRDTFYPPGYPLMLAVWAKVFNGGQISAFVAHAFNAVVLCADTLLAWIISQRLLGMLLVKAEGAGAGGEGGAGGHRRFFISMEMREWLAVLVAGIFATNWHVLECSLLVMSEPAFMLALFGLIATALAWPGWENDFWKSLLVAALAIMAWSIRGAGIVCVAAILVYPLLCIASELAISGEKRWRPRDLGRRIAIILMLAVMAVGYQAMITKLSPEKSVTSGEESANSYPKQLMHGLTDGGRLNFAKPGDYPRLAANLGELLLGHFNDYASSFVPWPRESPDLHFREVIGKIFGLLGLLGLTWQGLRAGKGGSGRGFVELLAAMYLGLYLVWPFHFARFWSPVLPIMLIYGVDGVVRFGKLGKVRGDFAAALLGLLLVLSAEEAWLQMGNYARRLNYVSDGVAAGIQAILRNAPDKPVVMAMNGDDHFALAWYATQIKGAERCLPVSPLPHAPWKGGQSERADELVWRELRDHKGRGERLFLFSYFGHVDAEDTLASVRKSHPEEMNGVVTRKIYQKEIVAAVWEIQPK